MEQKNEWAKVLPFLITVFPKEQTKTELAKLFSKLAKDLEAATGNKPQLVYPSVTAIMLLIEGRLNQIEPIVSDACNNQTHSLIVRIESPHSTFGLTSSTAWIQSALRRQKST